LALSLLSLDKKNESRKSTKLSNKLNRKLDEYPMHRTLLIFAFFVAIFAVASGNLKNNGLPHEEASVICNL